MEKMREHIHQSNLIESVTDPREVTQSLRAWQYLARQPEITEDVVLKTHYLIMERLWHNIAGHYRDCNVEVGGRVCPSWHSVPFRMEEWLLTFQKMTPQEAHVKFEHIHPFRDGNGRTGRMLMWWHEKSLGQEPTLIKFDERFKYYRWF